MFRIKRDPAKLFGSAVARSTQPLGVGLNDLKLHTEMRFTFAVILSLLVVSSVMPQDKQPNVTTEEYAVYSAAMSSLFSQQKHIIIIDHTDCTSLCTGSAYPDSSWVDRMRNEFPGLAQDIIDDYLRRNREPYQLQKHFSLKFEYSLLERKEIESKLHADPRKGTQEVYTQLGGILELSRVAFNPTMNQALVYLGYECGMLCGTGYFFLLNKDRNGTWVVLKRQTEWVS